MNERLSGPEMPTKPAAHSFHEWVTFSVPRIVESFEDTQKHTRTANSGRPAYAGLTTPHRAKERALTHEIQGTAVWVLEKLALLTRPVPLIVATLLGWFLAGTSLVIPAALATLVVLSFVARFVLRRHRDGQHPWSSIAHFVSARLLRNRARRERRSNGDE